MMTISPAVQQEIRSGLDALEAREGIRILFACESGSRAWGFPSRDSDYDVRFLYLRPLAWYLTVFPRRDVINQEMTGDLDVDGWDLRKALGLLRKGNAPLIEWLSSPIIYRRDEPLLRPLSDLVGPAFLPESVCHHYLAQTRRILAEIDEAGSQTKLKRYFYVIRALLAARWVVERASPPPTSLWSLIDGVERIPISRVELDALVEQKRDTIEQDRIDRRPDLERVLLAEHDALAARVPKNPEPPPAHLFDEALVAALRATGLSI